MNQTQFKRWSRVVNNCLDKLNLRDYQAYYHFTPIEADGLVEGEEIIGYCDAGPQNRWVNFILNKGYTGTLSNQDLESNAKHEALELFYDPIRKMLCEFYAADYVDGIIHKMIRVQEKLL